MIFELFDYLLIFSGFLLMIFMSVEDLIRKKVSFYPFIFFIFISLLWIFKQNFFPLTMIPILVTALILKIFSIFGKKLVAASDILFIIFSSVWFDVFEIPFFIFNSGFFVLVTFLIKKVFNSFALKKKKLLNANDFEEELKIPFFPAITFSTVLSFFSSYFFLSFFLIGH